MNKEELDKINDEKNICVCGHADYDHADNINICNVYGCNCEMFEDVNFEDFSDSGSELNK